MPDSGRAAWNFSSALRLLVGQTLDFASNWSRSNRFHVGSLVIGDWFAGNRAPASPSVGQLFWPACTAGPGFRRRAPGRLLAMDHAPPRQPGCTAERPGASASLLFCRSCAPPR